MAFCSKEKQLVQDGATTVDNAFLINYMPDAPDVRSAVYLLGLALSQSDGSDNSIETIASKLDVSTADVMASYEYWEEMGLVHITFDNPPSVVYLAPSSSAGALKKIKPGKYNKFSKAIQNVISGRMITVNEYNEYYLFLEGTTFESDALVAVAKYCTELKGNDISYNYVLTVARNLLAKGITTLALVEDNLNSQQKYDDDLRLVFKALKISRSFDHEDREFYEKWTKNMGFSQDVVCKVASKVKTGGMKKLDVLLSDYYKHNATSLVEIDGYESAKTELYDTAKEIVKCLGLYYQSLDAVVDEYVTGWMARGFDRKMLVAVAKYAFRCAVRTLSGYANVVEKLYLGGITSVEALDGYLCELAEKDEQISAVLQSAGLVRNVTQNDRNLFDVWTKKWAMSLEIVTYVAEKSAGTTSPLAYVNKVLADYKQNGIATLEQAKAHSQSTATATPNKPKRAVIGGVEIEKAEYTDSQLNALFTSLDEGED